ncbi:RNApolymerase 14 kDa subunit [Arabidopsis thaliana]|jgi:DNA-directed RNA polymerase I and III subunit RPAC2|uniref:DNA-directed RNA polymerase 14 kDa subunit (AtRPAC14) n=1 Tax=Arabidopsis thaliana TaxID=3702 RepID=Q42483_ARATH|nr:RNApolymerase 14 kDa subunit [Arabidopsis thaliana]NP_180514.1 RNApolymerase 14 kDa subunit [Arabidopsis thaliana]AAC49453.1 RNA polymerase I(A) and III(C) 14 kDa subunit [Arabidopsis thaliana]AAC49454.1 Arabidopsis thaliana RNA polymerase I(A) and III(C) 14 kDa subunit [Arabidopsis thaliana]AAC95185.1 DNA-directed RNA polymerase 14 kDa subunit (AtRPAC14) [Arabidopsis thaliana]AAO50492.1 putative DNA-directed RNA polymerase 14 kDa subunit (AtRPAC14) [Arabidopsis thaliana]AEC08269.1 RNApoly|eukprot:NP_001031443.1 RNApolymerase 14 kDa subunit [Arabidopsis thaliana]
MEHGSFTNVSHASFTLSEEDHTLANAVRFVLNQDPRVTVAAYTIPHPSLEQVNIRVQTTGDPAREVFKDACQELMQMNRHVRSVFDKAVAEYKDEQKRKEEAEEEELKRQRDLFGSMDIENN